MPISIAQAQAKLKDPGGESRDNYVVFEVSENVLEQYGIEFMNNLGKFANQKKVVDTGKLLSDSFWKVTDGNKLQVWLPDYFDFPNEGVKGVKSSRNAPGSPYQFKTYTMNANNGEGRKNIKRMIQRGHAKIKTVLKKNDAALGIGREKKHLALIDVQANTLIYLIKAYGIKTTNYFNKAIEETFKDFGQKMSEAMGQDIIFTLETLNKKRGSNN